MLDIVGSIMAYEQGELDGRGTLRLFSYLIATGDAWKLQGSYGRAAAAFIDDGWIDPQGVVDWERYEDLRASIAAQDREPGTEHPTTLF